MKRYVFRSSQCQSPVQFPWKFQQLCCSLTAFFGGVISSKHGYNCNFYKFMGLLWVDETQ